MRTKKFFSRRKAAWALFFLGAAAVIAWNPGAGSAPDGDGSEPPPAPEAPAPAEPDLPPTIWDRMVYPTDQQHLLEPGRDGVYQPTAAGELESALYGSVRTSRQGGRLLPSFHKGIDIAAVSRDRRNRPRDSIYAVVDGIITYVNRTAGNSSYGLYLVLLHDDPIGPVYTLYAHLASFADGVREGRRVAAGEILGVMGNTAGGYRIPLARAHLHFEIGLVFNSRFARWARSRKIRNDHKNYNGWNLMPIDPLEFFRAGAASPRLDFSNHLQSIPVAFEAVVRVEKLPDFFRRYPSLWEGPRMGKGAITIACCQYGIPLRGRAADPEETRLLGEERIRITAVDREVLGRNGRGVISPRGGGWGLGRNGANWLALLTY